MKISRKQLQKIINEEYRKLISEMSHRLPPAPEPGADSRSSVSMDKHLSGEGDMGDVRQDLHFSLIYSMLPMVVSIASRVGVTPAYALDELRHILTTESNEDLLSTRY